MYKYLISINLNVDTTIIANMHETKNNKWTNIVICRKVSKIYYVARRIWKTNITIIICSNDVRIQDIFLLVYRKHFE